jgi:hypothetical protein
VVAAFDTLVDMQQLEPGKQSVNTNRSALSSTRHMPTRSTPNPPGWRLRRRSSVQLRSTDEVDEVIRQVPMEKQCKLGSALFSLSITRYRRIALTYRYVKPSLEFACQTFIMSLFLIIWALMREFFTLERGCTGNPLPYNFSVLSRLQH